MTVLSVAHAFVALPGPRVAEPSPGEGQADGFQVGAGLRYEYPLGWMELSHGSYPGVPVAGENRGGEEAAAEQDSG